MEGLGQGVIPSILRSWGESGGGWGQIQPLLLHACGNLLHVHLCL